MSGHMDPLEDSMLRDAERPLREAHARIDQLCKELDCGCGLSGCRNVRRKCMACVVSDRDAEITRLRAQLARVEGERDEATARVSISGLEQAMCFESIPWTDKVGRVADYLRSLGLRVE